MRIMILLMLTLLAFDASSVQYVSHQQQGNQLLLQTSDGELTVTFLHQDVAAVHYLPAGHKQLPSFIIDAATVNTQLPLQLKDTPGNLDFGGDALQVNIQKAPLQLQFYRNGQLITREAPGFFRQDNQIGFRFALQPDEKLFGGGQRVLGMDRRGHRLPLYNKAHYGYSDYSEQMYFSLGGVMSSNKYMLLFDNSAAGHLDLGKTRSDMLEFSAVGGRTGYIVVAGDSFPHLIENYVTISGKAPLPARWTLGNYASRFGYRTEAEARDVVSRFRQLGLPLDAIVLDLYWFGPDIQGHMGNLDWDRNAFLHPEKMLADFAADGVKTILVTEPFILTSSERWQQAVDAGVMTPDTAGNPKTFDFYFGHTGLIDVFKPQAADWFWNIYKGLLQQGVAGVWGDLGEPEVHPADSQHFIGSADEVHNAYGHQWAELVYQGARRDFPEQRPFIMMRAGSLGSQRFGMVPWTGDVDRSWGGLKPQVELALQMSLFGFGYIHSDLGGFAGGEQFDRELYIRWLQYGVFQPVYRPHAQEHIAPEPVFHDELTISTLKPFLQLRYRLLPYLYSMAYQHSSTGMPLMRPLFFADEQNRQLMAEKNSYFWGDAFLVAPVTEPGVSDWPVQLPGGVWFDFFSGKRYSGTERIRIPVTLDTIPVLVKAGSFVPMAPFVTTTRDYQTSNLTVHYYADHTVNCAKGQMFEDDGSTPDSIGKGQFELLDFYLLQEQGEQRFEFSRSGGDYSGKPVSRELTLILHNQPAAPKQILLDGRYIQVVPQQSRFGRLQNVAYYDKAQQQLLVKFHWQQDKQQLLIR